MERTKNSKVMTIANRLTKAGMSRSRATIRAWILVKLERVETKVAGVTFGRRQEALEHLQQYSPDKISLELVREHDNPVDRAAVAVWAAVEGRGRYCVGYLARPVAAFVAPLMDAGKAVRGIFREVRGRYREYMNLGLVMEVVL